MMVRTIPGLARKLLDEKSRQNLQDRIAFHWQRLNHRHFLPALSAADQKIISDLDSEGVSITSLDELNFVETASFLSAADGLMPKLKVGLPVRANLLQAAEDLALEASRLKGRNLMGERDIYQVHASKFAMNEEAPEFFLYGLNDRLLNIAENHIGLPPAYIGADLARDLNEGADVANRRWHRDPEEAPFKRQLKVCVYLSDVTDESVCFEFIPKSLTPPCFYGTLANAEMENLVPKRFWKPCLGKRGTVIFAAINEIYHHARPPLASGEAERISAWFLYTSRNPSNKGICRSLVPLEALQLIEPKLSASQKEYLLWD